MIAPAVVAYCRECQAAYPTTDNGPGRNRLAAWQYAHDAHTTAITVGARQVSGTGTRWPEDWPTTLGGML